MIVIVSCHIDSVARRQTLKKDHVNRIYTFRCGHWAAYEGNVAAQQTNYSTTLKGRRLSVRLWGWGIECESIWLPDDDHVNDENTIISSKLGLMWRICPMPTLQVLLPTRYCSKVDLFCFAESILLSIFFVKVWS